MAVYVDKMRPAVRNQNWRYDEACHLIADSERELHIFARRLNLKYNWFQPKILSHYDLTKNKRKKAVRLGAIEITDIQLIEKVEEYRKLKAGINGK